jgi:hypothetical protein
MAGGSATQMAIWPHRQIANQRQPADAMPYPNIVLVMACSRFKCSARPRLCTARLARIRRQMWHSRSLIIQAKCGTFVATDRVSAVLVPSEKGKAMRKTLLALAAVATLAVSAIATPQAAEARGGRIAAGIAAGVIGSAIVGGAIASQNGYYGPGYYGPSYGPGYGYYGGPAYVADPYDAPCIWQRQRFWDGYGWRVRRVQVCD